MLIILFGQWATLVVFSIKQNIRYKAHLPAEVLDATCRAAPAGTQPRPTVAGLTIKILNRY